MSDVPGLVTGVTDAVIIAAGPNHTCAGSAANTVRCWGANEYGQLGNGLAGDSNVAVMVQGL
jgi:alpha-tubulin suppressor-like RCC1 family protein